MIAVRYSYHEHCGPPAAARFSFAIFNAGLLLGVAMAGSPVATAFDGRGILEVNRLCLRRDIPRALVWNACSQLYARCAQEAERRGFGKIITYKAGRRGDRPCGRKLDAGFRCPRVRLARQATGPPQLQ